MLYTEENPTTGCVSDPACYPCRMSAGKLLLADPLKLGALSVEAGLQPSQGLAAQLLAVAVAQAGGGGVIHNIPERTGGGHVACVWRWVAAEDTLLRCQFSMLWGCQTLLTCMLKGW